MNSIPNALRARGTNSQQHILWMALFAQGIDGRRGLPYILVGKPGSVKTGTLRMLAQHASLRFESVLGSIRSPVDFLGVPVPRTMQLGPADQHLSPDGDDKFLYMHYAPAGFALRAALAQRSLILFDEASTMAASVQKAMLRVLFEGVVGEMDLPKTTRMMLAMNEIEDAVDGQDIAMPLANRMGWLPWEPPTVAEFTRYLLSGSDMLGEDPVDPAAEERALDAVWPAAWASAAGQVAGFLQARGDRMLLNPPETYSKDTRAWCSPRSWEFATRALAGSLAYGLSGNEQAAAVGAYIGAGAFSEFFNWRQTADLPDPAALLDGQLVFQHNPARLDRTAAVLTSAAALVTPGSCANRQARVAKLWEILRDMPQDAVDVCLPTVVSMARNKLTIGQTVAYQVLGRLEPVMSAAGISRIS